ATIGAGQPERALRIALTGGAMAFALAEVIGLAAALFPEAWLRLFGAEDHMLEAGAAYLRIVGPVYGFFALGFSMYFASQGAGRLKWPLWAGVLRLATAIGAGGAVLRLTGSLAWFFAVAALAMVLYGLVILAAVASGSWFERGHLRESRLAGR
ncbi:MATE family efflux transporter, partial [Achromobacter ruhlandii]|uniref:MATE family efflux transporter n=1 Tax=Achromobacter ruhlandii TaxID=72557 RepID=UPI003BA0D5B9